MRGNHTVRRTFAFCHHRNETAVAGNEPVFFWSPAMYCMYRNHWAIALARLWQLCTAPHKLWLAFLSANKHCGSPWACSYFYVYITMGPQHLCNVDKKKLGQGAHYPCRLFLSSLCEHCDHKCCICTPSHKLVAALQRLRGYLADRKRENPSQYIHQCHIICWHPHNIFAHTLGKYSELTAAQEEKQCGSTSQSWCLPLSIREVIIWCCVACNL